MFVAAVLALRLAGLGTNPPTVGAAAPDRVSEAEQARADVNSALVSMVSAVDIAEYAEATARCLAAGFMCTHDDLRDLDTTRIRIVSLATRLGEAIDPASDAFLGEADQPTTARMQGIDDKANRATHALDAFLASGCAGSIDGVPVEQAPSRCNQVTASATTELAAFNASLSDPVDP